MERHVAGTIIANGDDEPHNNMQPYYALYACAKTVADSYDTSNQFLMLESNVTAIKDTELPTISSNIATMSDDIDDLEIDVTGINTQQTVLEQNISDLVDTTTAHNGRLVILICESNRHKQNDKILSIL